MEVAIPEGGDGRAVGRSGVSKSNPSRQLHLLSLVTSGWFEEESKGVEEVGKDKGSCWSRRLNTVPTAT